MPAYKNRNHLPCLLGQREKMNGPQHSSTRIRTAVCCRTSYQRANERMRSNLRDQSSLAFVCCVSLIARNRPNGQPLSCQAIARSARSLGPFFVTDAIAPEKRAVDVLIMCVEVDKRSRGSKKVRYRYRERKVKESLKDVVESEAWR